MDHQQFTDWHRQLAAGVADATELDNVDRGPLTQPAELTDETALAEFEVARTPGKAARWHQVNDQHANDLQVQFQGYIGGLPA